MKKLYIAVCILFLTFSMACKDSQMDNDPMGELTVELTGTVNPPAVWERPMIYAYYPRDGREYGAVIVAPVKNNAFRLFVEKDTDVELYLFNDLDNNGGFDYLTEPKLPHSLHPFVATKTDTDVGEIVVRAVSGLLTYPIEWDKPSMYLMKGNDIYAYYPITPGVNPAPYTFYTGDGNDYKMFVFNDSGGQDADGVYDYLTETSIAYSGNPLNITSDLPDQDMKVWKVTGRVSVPSDWQHPKMVVLKNNAIVTYGGIANNAYSMYVIEGSDYEVYTFDDLDNNGTYDYKTEKLYTHLTSKLIVNATTTVTDLNVRKISGAVSLPSTWSYPMMALLKGNDVAAYANITGGAYYFYAVDGTDYKVKTFNDVNNNSAFDYQSESLISHQDHESSSLTLAADTTMSAMTIRTFSGTLTNVPTTFTNLTLKLVVFTSTWGYATDYTTVLTGTNSTRTYTLYGLPRTKHRILLFNDANADGTRNNAEPLYYIGKRDNGAPLNDTQVIDSSSADKTVDIAFGTISGSISNTGGWLRPYAGLNQGWDNLCSDNTFTLNAIASYTVDGGSAVIMRYAISIFNDDETANGYYDSAEYDPGTEYKEYNNGGSYYTTSDSPGTLNTTP